MQKNNSGVASDPNRNESDFFSSVLIVLTSDLEL